MIWSWQSFFLSIFTSFVLSSIVGYFLGQWHHRDKRKALDELGKVLGEHHAMTHKAFLDLQSVIHHAKDLAEVRRYLNKQADDFVRSLRAKIVPITSKKE